MSQSEKAWTIRDVVDALAFALESEARSCAVDDMDPGPIRAAVSVACERADAILADRRDVDKAKAMDQVRAAQLCRLAERLHKKLLGLAPVPAAKEQA